MFVLKNNSEQSAIAIAKGMGLERTTVQKAIKKLLERNLIKRARHKLPKGGYVFLYVVNEKNEIKNKIKKIVYDWYIGVKREIDRW